MSALLASWFSWKLRSTDPRTLLGTLSRVAQSRRADVVDSVGALLRGNPLPEVRMAAAYALGRIGGDRSMHWLMQQLTLHDDDMVTTAALDAVAAVDAKDSTQFDDFFTIVKRRAPRLDSAWARAFASFGSFAVGSVMQMLDRVSDDLYAFAFDVLQALPDHLSLPALLRLLTTSHWDTALRLLNEHYPHWPRTSFAHDSLPTLLRLLFTRPPRQWVSLLEHVDADWMHHPALVEWITFYGVPDLDSLGEQWPDALWLVTLLRHRGSIRGLIRCLNTQRDENVRAACVDALRIIDPQWASSPEALAHRDQLLCDFHKRPDASTFRTLTLLGWEPRSELERALVCAATRDWMSLLSHGADARSVILHLSKCAIKGDADAKDSLQSMYGVIRERVDVFVVAWVAVAIGRWPDVSGCGVAALDPLRERVRCEYVDTRGQVWAAVLALSALRSREASSSLEEWWTSEARGWQCGPRRYSAMRSAAFATVGLGSAASLTMWLELLLDDTISREVIEDMCKILRCVGRDASDSVLKRIVSLGPVLAETSRYEQLYDSDGAIGGSVAVRTGSEPISTSELRLLADSELAARHNSPPAA